MFKINIENKKLRNIIYYTMKRLEKKYPILNQFSITFKLKDISNISTNRPAFALVPLEYNSKNFTININSKLCDNIDNTMYKLKHRYKTKYGVSKNCKINALIIHEVGHIIDFYIWQNNNIYQEYRNKLFENKNGIKSHLSTYALSAPRECMAEAFVKHYFYPNNSFVKQLNEFI